MATDTGARADVVKLVAIALAIAVAIYSMAPVGRAIPHQHHERPDSPTLPSRVPQPQSSDAALSAPASQWWHGEECHPASALPALDDKVCGELSNATDAHVARLFVNITPPTTEHVNEFDAKAFANFSRLAFAKQLCELQQFSGCMTWIAGRMDLNESAATAQPLPFDPRCSTFPDGRVDLDACAASIVASVQQYHGTALVHALARRTNGTVIVFTGDSVTRQLFLAFIAVLRGQLAFTNESATSRLAPYLEHYFHSDAQYTLLSDGRDYLDIGPEHWAEVACEAGRHGTTAAPVYLSVCFAWDPFQRHIKFRRTVPLIAALERNSTSVAAIVHILPYQWANTGLRASRAVEPRSRPARGKKHLFPEDAHLHMETYLKLLTGTRPRGSTRQVLLPITVVPYLPTVDAYANRMFSLRNELVLNWTRATTQAGAANGTVRLATVDLGAWSIANNIDRCDKVHYGCNVVPMMHYGFAAKVKAICSSCIDRVNPVLVATVIFQLLT
jgi:hypothetical protein